MKRFVIPFALAIMLAAATAFAAETGYSRPVAPIGPRVSSSPIGTGMQVRAGGHVQSGSAKAYAPAAPHSPAPRMGSRPQQGRQPSRVAGPARRHDAGIQHPGFGSRRDAPARYQNQETPRQRGWNTRENGRPRGRNSSYGAKDNFGLPRSQSARFRNSRHKGVWYGSSHR